MDSIFQRTLTCLALMLAATIAGLAWRLAPLHLPWFFFKYGGSALWAIALYWLIAALLPRLTPLALAVVAALAALAVEFSRLLHTPSFDAFRLTFAGRFLLGRFFNPRNIAAYWLAIAAAALFDRWLQRRTRSTSTV
jgi:hypothetical protein